LRGQYGRSGEHAFEDVWQYCEILSDAPPSALRLRTGEVQIDHFKPVEDNPGNPGKHGMLVVTNLRLIWTSKWSSNTYSIGLDCVSSMKVGQVSSMLEGATHALFCRTHFSGEDFEYVFAAPVDIGQRLFTTAHNIFESYDSSRLYRDLRLRDAAIIQDKELVLLPQEKVYEKIRDIVNVSANQGNLGMLIITSFRTVWFAEVGENYNASIPYLQMKRLYVSTLQRFGRALVIETTASSGGYKICFRSHPVDYVESICAHIVNIGKAFYAAPIFGVECTLFTERCAHCLEARKEGDTEEANGEATAVCCQC